MNPESVLLQGYARNGIADLYGQSIITQGYRGSILVMTKKRRNSATVSRRTIELTKRAER